MIQLNHAYRLPALPDLDLFCTHSVSTTEQWANKPPVTKTEYILEGGGYSISYPEGSKQPSQILFHYRNVTADKDLRVFSNPVENGHGDPPGEPGAPGEPGPRGIPSLEAGVTYITRAGYRVYCHSANLTYARCMDLISGDNIEYSQSNLKPSNYKLKGYEIYDIETMYHEGLLYEDSIGREVSCIRTHPESGTAEVSDGEQEWTVNCRTNKALVLNFPDIARPLPSRPLPATDSKIQFVEGECYICSGGCVAVCSHVHDETAIMSDGINTWAVNKANGRTINPGYPTVLGISPVKSPVGPKGEVGQTGHPGVPGPGATNSKTTRNKRRYTLIPQVALDQCADVFGFGAAKYSPNNWQNETNPDVYIDAAMRHLAAIRNGELIDLDHGQSHAAAVMTNAAILVWLFARPKVNPNQDRPINRDLLKEQFRPK